MKAWGFKYKTVALTWLKTDSKGDPSFGMGFYTRQSMEFCLLGVRGKPLERMSKSVRQTIIAPVRKHSQKPDEQYERIEQLYGSSLDNLEMFARTPRPDWTQLGNSIGEEIDIKESIQKYV